LPVFAFAYLDVAIWSFAGRFTQGLALSKKFAQKPCQAFFSFLAIFLGGRVVTLKE